MLPYGFLYNLWYSLSLLPPSLSESFPSPSPNKVFFFLHSPFHDTSVPLFPSLQQQHLHLEGTSMLFTEFPPKEIKANLILKEIQYIVLLHPKARCF